MATKKVTKQKRETMFIAVGWDYDSLMTENSWESAQDAADSFNNCHEGPVIKVLEISAPVKSEKETKAPILKVEL